MSFETKCNACAWNRSLPKRAARTQARETPTRFACLQRPSTRFIGTASVSTLPPAGGAGAVHACSRQGGGEPNLRTTVDIVVVDKPSRSAVGGGVYGMSVICHIFDCVQSIVLPLSGLGRLRLWSGRDTTGRVRPLVSH